MDLLQLLPLLITLQEVHDEVNYKGNDTVLFSGNEMKGLRRSQRLVRVGQPVSYSAVCDRDYNVASFRCFPSDFPRFPRFPLTASLCLVADSSLGMLSHWSFSIDNQACDELRFPRLAPKSTCESVLHASESENQRKCRLGGTALVRAYFRI